MSFGVIKYLKDSSYNVIIIGGHGYPTGMLSIQYLKYKKIPFILNMDGGIVRNDSKLLYLIKKYLISNASAWLSSGTETDNYLERYGAKKINIYRYPFTSLRGIDILKHPVSLSDKLTLRAALGINEEKIVISVGQFIYRKGYDVLLKAAAKIEKNVGIYIIGGKPTDGYKLLIKKYNLCHFHFIEFKSKEELRKYYLMADLFVLPTREDVWGLVINEAMAYGLPVITTNKCVAGTELVKDNENGFIVPIEDDDALARKITIILNDEQARIEMSKKSLKRIKDCTIENMAKVHLEIFRIITNKLGGE